MNINTIHETVRDNAERVAKLGQWPEYIDPASLVDRVPTMTKTAPGFDAGVACALGLIPSQYQKLAAQLHANYSKETVEQILRETKNGTEFDPNTDSAWWLAASYFCEEDHLQTVDNFQDSVDKFRACAEDPQKISTFAQMEYEHIKGSFRLVNNIPFGVHDGCIQGAYVCGHVMGVHYHQKHGIFFIGTYEDSLGLEDFKWSDAKDEDGQAMSGPVHGHQNYVKCSSFYELSCALDIAELHLKGAISK